MDLVVISCQLAHRSRWGSVDFAVLHFHGLPLALTFMSRTRDVDIVRLWRSDSPNCHCVGDGTPISCMHVLFPMAVSPTLRVIAENLVSRTEFNRFGLTFLICGLE